MKNIEISLFLVTRFGIGQNSRDFFDKEFPYFENFLVKSILSQKRNIKKWIIIIDINTPKYVVEKLQNLVPADLLYLYFHDCFASGSLMPKISLILCDIGIKNNDKIITVRVDADDMLSSNYTISVINTIKKDNLLLKYDNISVNAPYGIYFYPIRKRLIKVFKKDYSVQALYSIFGENFHSVHDYGHQKIAEKILSQGGYYCELDKQAHWIRSMRQFSVTKFGLKFGIFETRFFFIKNMIKKIFYKYLKNNTFYEGLIDFNYLTNNFNLSKEIIIVLEKHEQKLSKIKFILPPLVKKIIKSKKVNVFFAKNELIQLHNKEKNENKKIEIKKEFYKF
jgi:hypothetical protein